MIQKIDDDHEEVGVMVYGADQKKLGYFLMRWSEVKDTVNRGYIHCWSYKTHLCPSPTYHPHPGKPVPDPDDPSLLGRFTLWPIMRDRNLYGFELEGDPAIMRQFDNFTELQ